MAPTFVEYSDDESYFEQHGTPRPDPHFVDLNALQDSRWDDFATTLGIKNLTQMVGQTEIEYNERTHVVDPRSGERIKIDPKPPWSAELENWQDPSVGLAFIQAMRTARPQWWCDNRDFAAVDETLDTLEKSLMAAQKRGARFRLC